MSTPQTPADELRQAAKTLRDTAADVEYGAPWAVADDCPDIVVSGDLRPYGAPTVGTDLDEGNAAWIALVHPALAEPLAQWLEFAAEHWQHDANLKHYPVRGDLQRISVDLARQINAAREDV